MTFESLARRLRGHDYRLTPQRVAVLQAMAALGGHPTAREICKRARRIHPTVCLATVYNTLETLCTTCAVSAIQAGGKRRYDANPAPHVNLVCRECGRVEDLWVTPGKGNGLVEEGGGEARTLTQAAVAAAMRAGFHVASLHVVAHGTCQACGGQEHKRGT
jgi:Fe2+ or Zn2+ uptake regulation protein